MQPPASFRALAELLTALEKANRRLVGIVLCGQPSLLGTLSTDRMRALNERITRRVSLAPLATDEVAPYIHHRLAIVGGTKAVGFGSDAVAAVAALADGLPRRINVVCDRALEEGRLDGVSVITADLIGRAARSVGLQTPAPTPDEATSAAQPPPTLVLGQRADRRGTSLWTALALAAAFAALAFAGYTYLAESTLSDVAIGSVAQTADTGAPPPSSALPPPPDEEFLRLLTPPIAAPIVAPSAELPDDSNQLN